MRDWITTHPLTAGILAGLAASTLGVVCSLAVWHLWQDHQLLHQAVGALNQVIQAQQAAHPPSLPGR